MRHYLTNCEGTKACAPFDKWRFANPTQPLKQSVILTMNIDETKQLPHDKKINLLPECMSNMSILKFRVDNIESQLFVNCARHKTSWERIKLLEYKNIDLEVQCKARNRIITSVLDFKEENIVQNIFRDIIISALKLEDTFTIVNVNRQCRIITPKAPHLSSSRQGQQARRQHISFSTIQSPRRSSTPAK